VLCAFANQGKTISRKTKRIFTLKTGFAAKLGELNNIFEVWNFKIKALPLWSVFQKGKKMKKDIHPEYKEVVFYDTSSDYKFITRSTMTSEETIKWEDGKEYPLVKVEVSSASHPFYTGKKLYVDTAGRVEKFNKKYAKKPKADKE